jgi:hypothetical protein
MKKLVTTFLFSILLCTISYAQPLSGSYYIPKGVNPQGYDSLSLAVADLNTNGCLGTVYFVLDADTLRDTTFIFNASLSAVNNVVVKPAPGRNVTLISESSPSVGNGPFMIGFNKGYVTFDGSNNGSNSRNLIITTEQVLPVVDIPFSLNTADADSVVLKNLIIKNIFAGQTNFRYGAVIDDIDGVWGFRVENCQIGTLERPVRRDGLAPWGSTGTPKSQFSFINNDIFAGTRGITTLWFSESEIIGNTINLLPTTAGNTYIYMHGIYLTGESGVSYVRDNVVNCLEKTSNASGYLMGIAFAGNNIDVGDSVYVVNNMINVGASDETRNMYGIGLRSAQTHGNLKIFHNTILINNNASALISYGIGNHTNGTGPVKIDLKNNIVINNHSGNPGSSAIGLIPVTSVLNSNFNTLISNQNFVNYQGTLYANLAAWQSGSGQDLNSFSNPVTFVSATDLHLSGGSVGDGNLASASLGVTTDFDGDARNAYWPYMGADEITGSPLSLKLTLKALIQGFWNYDSTIVQDTLEVSLGHPTLYTKSASFEGLSSSSGYDFYLPKGAASSYYVVVNHINTLETWSNSAITFPSGEASYDFTDAQNKAYGSVQKNVGGRWCLINGDTNQDQYIDGSDYLEIVNNWEAGDLRMPGDTNGDVFIDGSDYLQIVNNFEIGSAIPPFKKLAKPIK